MAGGYGFLGGCFAAACGIFDRLAGVGTRKYYAKGSASPSEPPSRPVTQDDFRKYMEELDGRIDRKFNERANELQRQVEFDQEKIRELMESNGSQSGRISELQTELSARETFYEAAKERDAETLSQKEGEIGRLGKRVQDLAEVAGRRKAAHKAAHCGLRKARQDLEDLRRASGSHYRVRMLEAVMGMRSAGKQAYLTEVGLMEELLDWARKAEEADLKPEYVGQVISCLENGCSKTKKERRKVFSALLSTKEKPDRALEALSRYGLVR